MLRTFEAQLKRPNFKEKSSRKMETESWKFVARFLKISVDEKVIKVRESCGSQIKSIRWRSVDIYGGIDRLVMRKWVYGEIPN